MPLCLVLLLCFSLPGNTAENKEKVMEKTPHAGGQVFSWPNGAAAAVCLTYDDCLDGHLDIVAPDLERLDLRGTFYVPGACESLSLRMDQWRDLVRRGHELGNHSLFHPCYRIPPGGEVREWVRPEYSLENYTVSRMLGELRTANTLLRAVDGRQERTFAYTCYETSAGGVSFVDEIKPLFTAARAAGDIPPDMQEVDLYLIPSWGCEGSTGGQLIAYAERAADAGTLAVYTFHGVGEEHELNVARDEHRKLIEYLGSHRDRFWTATVAEAASHIRAERKRLGWDR